MSATELTPQERLAISRRAIVRHMKRDTDPDESQFVGEDGSDKGQGNRDLGGTWTTIKNAFGNWWHYHPANVALDFAKPAISKYAEEQPFKLLAVAAGVGAASVVLRPWRLISLGGVALAALKSSEFSGMVLSMISKAGSKSSTSSNRV